MGLLRHRLHCARAVLPASGFLAVLALLLPGATSRAEAPAAPPAAAAIEGDDAVLLEESLDVEYRSPAQARVRYTNRLQVLTPRGVQEYPGTSISYGPGAVIRDVQAAVVLPSGKRVEVKRQQIVDRAPYGGLAMYSDQMERVIPFSGQVPGSILEYSYEEEVNDVHFLPERMTFQDTVPARLMTFTVHAPSDLPLRVRMLHGASPETSRDESGGVVTLKFTARDVPPLRGEDSMPPRTDLAPEVSVSPRTVVYAGHTVDISDWGGIGRFEWDIAHDRLDPAPEVAEMARSLAGPLPDQDAKVRAIYEFVQGKINYVSIDLGIGGWQPHPNGDVFKYRYGDCKDKATLMIAMLRAVGVTAYPVLINTRDDGLIDLDSPGLVFNHAITALPREDGYLFLDPTYNTRTVFGDLPWVDQGVSALVVKPDGVTEVVTTPLSTPEHNRRRHTIDAALSPGGGLSGTDVIEAWGQQRAGLEEELDRRKADRDRTMQYLLTWLCPGATLKGYDVTPPAGPADPLRIKVQFEVPRYMTHLGDLEVASPLVVRFRDLTGLGAKPKRVHPILFGYLHDEVSEVRLALPRGRTLRKVPADRNSDGPGLSAATHYELAQDGDHKVLVVKRSVTVSKREIPASDYPLLRTFLSGLVEEEANAVTLISGS